MEKAGRSAQKWKKSSRKGSQTEFAVYYFLVFLSFLLRIA
jgi:hypothetical protein